MKTLGGGGEAWEAPGQRGLFPEKLWELSINTIPSQSFLFFFPSQTAIEVLDMKSCLFLSLYFSTAPIAESENVSLKWISQPNLLLGDRGPCWVLLGAQAREKVTFFSRCPTTIQPL